MPSSTRRRIFRLQLGVNRKSTVTRWIGCLVVRITCNRAKASEGAEKSCRVRRKSRGQRRGKRRARGCHPRDPQPTARSANDPTDRRINNHLRAVDWAQDRVDQFGKLMRSSKLVGLWSGSRYTSLQPERYSVWKLRWLALRNHITTYGEAVRSVSGIGSSFSFFLEQRFGILLSARELMLPVRARAVLLDMAAGLEIRNNFLSVRNRPDGDPHRYTVHCNWCRTAWGSSSRSSRCQVCTRLCSAPVRRGVRRGKRGVQNPK